MGWFGRKSVSEGRGLVPSFLLGNEGSGFARGYAAQYDKVYRRNPVGQRCVRLVAGMVAGLPVYDGGGRDEAAALVMRDGLLEQVAAALLLHGNAFVQLVADARDRPAELHALRPERVSVATDAAGWPAAYVYRAGTAATRVARKDALGRRQMVHLSALNPGDYHYGLGCLDLRRGAWRGGDSSSQPTDCAWSIEPRGSNCRIVAGRGTRVRRGRTRLWLAASRYSVRGSPRLPMPAEEP